jgi:hypothetical protein
MLARVGKLFCKSFLEQNLQVLKTIPKKLIEGMLLMINKKYKGMPCLLETYRFLAKQIDV